MSDTLLRPVALWALLTLSGCALTPDPYERPSPGLPARWSAQTSTHASAAKWPAPVAWQSLYTDLRLQALIRMALERNHDVRMALARIDEARALWGVQRADQVPNLSLGASHTSARTPALVQGNPSAVNVRRYDLGLNLLSFELDVWGRVASLSDAARLNFQATEEDRRTIRLSLVSDVANTYYGWLEAQQRLELLRLTEANRNQFLTLIQKRAELGAASGLDLALAQNALQNLRAERQTLERQVELARNALGLLIGGQWPKALPEGLPMALQSLDLAWGAELPSDTLLQRPDVRAAEQRLMAAHANIQAARVAFLPRLQLTGLLGSASPALNQLMGGGSQAWNFVPSLQQPLFDGGRTESGLDLAMARKNQAVVAYEKTLQQAFREVADVLVTRDTLQEQWQQQNLALNSMREREQLVEMRHRLGAASLQEWLDAQRDLMQAEQAQVQTQRLWLGATAQLFKALGGGDL